MWRWLGVEIVLFGLAGTAALGVAAEQGLAQTMPTPFQEPAPAAACPNDLTACTYAETLPFGLGVDPARYRVQARRGCGANCTETYWVTNAATGQVLLYVSDRGAVLATREDQVRAIVPSDVGRQGLCCPIQFTDTTYTWDSARGALMPLQALTLPAEDYDRAVQALEGAGFQRVLH